MIFLKEDQTGVESRLKCAVWNAERINKGDALEKHMIKKCLKHEKKSLIPESFIKQPVIL